MRILEKELIVRAAPQYYQCQEGVLNQLEPLLKERGIVKILMIHGEKSLEAAKDYLPSFNETFVHDELYSGECSLSEIERLTNVIKQSSFEAVIGIGGGKVLDLTKAVGDEAKVPTILIPTLASNCAPWTPLTVYYNDEGQFLYYKYHKTNTNIVLVEPRIILDSPLQYFTAGIADTLAKWYEADVIIRKLEEIPLSVEIAYYAAKTCKDVLIQNSIKAVEDLKRGELSYELVKVIETVFMAGGMVGGFGDEYGRVSGAHAIHNGLTQVPDTHHLLHGEKVAYGILVQLALEENWDEIKHLLNFYKALGLPYNLAALHLSLADSSKLQKVIEAAVKPEETIHLIGENVSAEKLLNAIKRLEEFTVLV
ncbi:glycerol dehydrogenase [Heyndrickxia ginsengihumi]|uniref:Glycerol dehydrogenase n=1 Tax=Heyndrickxia ginsengihumi TaxID=363870 RepID=A0A0A6VFZ3_9BACI|nr:iron-containing alcohol dehydrogenase family protein [Heyndrickxia ginsengihumi]KHD85549.1 glycerol dehydrogenase [Heyndrickxia ginsengihumi]